MNISQDERDAIKAVLAAGERFGYGNMISHLQTAWAKTLIDADDGFDEKSAREIAGPGYPFKMQDDLVTHAMWDESGERYKAGNV